MKTKTKNKRGIAPLLIIILLVAGLVGFLGAGKLAEIVGSGEYIERPAFYYVKCEALSGLTYSQKYLVANAGSWATKPSVSSSYNLKINRDSTPALTCPYIEYAVCNQMLITAANCRIPKTQVLASQIASVETALTGLKSNEVVWLRYVSKCLGGEAGISGLSYQISYVPYGLREYNVLSGSSNPIGIKDGGDCTLPSTDASWRDRFVSSNSQDVNAIISKNVNQLTLQPEEVRWFVGGYLTSAAPSFKLTYSGVDAWCRTTGETGEIYKINTITLGSGTYKIASVDYSDKLGNVACCPKATRGDQVCNDNFAWVQIAGSECGAFKSCGSPDWSPYSEGMIIKYSCVNGYCKSETKQVQCANDYDCKDANKICNLNYHTCVQANVDLQGQVIETIPDNKADCELKGGKWISETTEEKTLLNYIGIGSPKVVVKDYCDLGGFNWKKLIIIGAIILVILIFWKQIIIGFKWLLGRVGVRI